jgi:phosphoglycerate dehydrogenase-like enzyme
MLSPRVGSLVVLTGALVFVSAAGARSDDAVTVCLLASLAKDLGPLEQAHPALRLLSAEKPADLVARAAECDGVVGLWGSDVADVVRAGRKLRWVQVGSAGVERYVSVPALRDSDIVLTNAKIVQGPEIADHAFALLLNLTRDIKTFGLRMSDGWGERRSELPMIELRGRTALVIGLGGIGTQVAQRAAGFGMRVLAVDPKDVPIHRDVDHVGKPDELDALLPEADVVFSCVPHTPRSEQMLGARQFELMKKGVYLVNVSRGPIVDTDALVAALRSGKVAGAGLDVTDPEPLPADHPLWKMPNVIITPHVAGVSDRIGERRLELYRDNVGRFATGRPLRNVVDKARGY